MVSIFHNTHCVIQVGGAQQKLDKREGSLKKCDCYRYFCLRNRNTLFSSARRWRLSQKLSSPQQSLQSNMSSPAKPHGNSQQMKCFSGALGGRRDQGLEKSPSQEFPWCSLSLPVSQLARAVSATPGVAPVQPVWLVRAADRGAAQAPPPCALRDRGQPRRRQGSHRGTPRGPGKALGTSCRKREGEFTSERLAGGCP